MNRLLSYTRHREVMGDAELMRRRLKQPVADLAVLLGAMKRFLLRQQCCANHHKPQKCSFLHGSLRATIFTGSWSSRSFRKLTRTRPSLSVETIPGDAHSTSSQPLGSTTTLRLMPNGRMNVSCPLVSVYDGASV